jgi:hypothetical protein
VQNTLATRERASSKGTEKGRASSRGATGRREDTRGESLEKLSQTQSWEESTKLPSGSGGSCLREGIGSRFARFKGKLCTSAN